ncbi:hypothetical protein [Roseibium alexandrii]|uniref:Uncharacterized protein n=1 Tax=Roseibium alexandrii TaxID=388408 RepID=A0A0M7A733_9HYPH|nr:hypothetical protein [Roseibium alexandrii]CTQ70965.1 hypothetical protein LAX5112_02669 [Roseibium alexandrii]
MTVHLITAYREIDDLLLECLVNWAEVAEQVRGSFTEPEVHIEFAQRSTYLVEARASVEAALRALDGVNNQIASEAGASIQVSDAANGRSQDHGQCGCVDPGFPVGADHSLPADVSSSRPDRPQRPQEHCRGQIRDWNRDILACRHQKIWGAGNADRSDPASGRSSAQRIASIREQMVSRLLDREPPPPEWEQQTSEPSDEIKEPENGPQTKSSRPRRRG